ncbi:MAG: SUF system Fe-S cluster assembly protein [Candidatus Krumholzibacteria bacterium]|nr:SUF system Fe-S cluster assembly protein [Candidatus Krumholzibacteria bacterium]
MEENTVNSELKQKVIDVLKTVYDPEIPVDVYELGLVYNVDIKAGDAVEITMTLTSPACPVAESLPPQIEEKVAAIEGVSTARVDITWDPPWAPEMMSEAARLTLGF